MRTSPLHPRAMMLAVFAAVVAMIAGTFVWTAPAFAAVGTISGTVVEAGTSNGLSGITVSLYDDSGIFSFVPPPPIATTTTGPSGEYSFAVATAGDYDVGASSDDWVQNFEYVTFYDPVIGHVVPDLELEPGVVLTGVVRDAHTGIGIPNAVIFVFDASLTTIPFSLGVLTDSAGAYRVSAPLDSDVQLAAFVIDSSFGFLYWPQVWDHQSFFSFGCTCGQGVIMTPPVQGLLPIPPPDYDFDLFSIDNVLVSIQAWDDTVPPGTEYPGLTVHLYKKSGSSWVEINFDDTDTLGLADVFGPDGVPLRLRFSLAGTFVPVEYALDFDFDPLTLGTDGCWVELGSLASSGSSPTPYDVEVSLDTTRSSCPATMPMTPTNVPVVPPAPNQSSGLMNLVPSPTPTPTPSATPTSSPSPSSSPSSSPSPSPTSPPLDIQPLDFSWILWLVVALILGIVITVIVIVRRR